MTALAKLSALLAILYLIKELLYPFFRPVSGKQKKRTRLFLKERKRNAFQEKWQRWKGQVAHKYVRNLISTADRIRYKKIIDRLDLTIKPEDIRTEQLLYAGAGLLLTLLMLSANRLLGCATATFIILGWLYPISELEKTIERKNRNISLDFPGFYSMVYYQYSKSVNIFLMDVIKDYLPNANPDMAEELGVMLDNMDYGEEYALKQLKKRVPLRYVIKFCDIMETRLKGYDNVSQMLYLKNEVEEYRIRELEEELERRERSNARIQWILIVILMIYITIYYLFMIMESLKLFQ
jgi:Flp pilus assembly protein TadB